MKRILFLALSIVVIAGCNNSIRLGYESVKGSSDKIQTATNNIIKYKIVDGKIYRYECIDILNFKDLDAKEITSSINSNNAKENIKNETDKIIFAFYEKYGKNKVCRDNWNGSSFFVIPKNNGEDESSFYNKKEYKIKSTINYDDYYFLYTASHIGSKEPEECYAFVLFSYNDSGNVNIVENKILDKWYEELEYYDNLTINKYNYCDIIVSILKKESSYYHLCSEKLIKKIESNEIFNINKFKKIDSIFPTNGMIEDNEGYFANKVVNITINLNELHKSVDGEIYESLDADYLIFKYYLDKKNKIDDIVLLNEDYYKYAYTSDWNSHREYVLFNNYNNVSLVVEPDRGAYNISNNFNYIVTNNFEKKYPDYFVNGIIPNRDFCLCTSHIRLEEDGEEIYNMFNSLKKNEELIKTISYDCNRYYKVTFLVNKKGELDDANVELIKEVQIDNKQMLDSIKSDGDAWFYYEADASDIKNIEYYTQFYPSSKNATIDFYDTIKFGKNDDMYIDWIILDKKDDKALLFSKYILNIMQNNSDIIENDWKHSSLKEYLNKNFFDKTFSKKEKQYIEKNNIDEDRVFLLSKDELLKYFNLEDFDSRILGSGMKNNFIVSDFWNEMYSNYVVTDDDKFGFVDKEGKFFNQIDTNIEIGIRPAMWVKYK